MMLTFLGQPYEANQPGVAQVPTAQTGKYRGAAVQFSAAHVARRTNVQLTYRGRHYTH
ncbi:MAG TPA: DUF4278 domain-containing protein [Leptolyngbyaceae cyanobacterium M33_DOE_097]|uniref:DUF4278 domain-containing protein n=1 Tax=Oscillatoriales cyanobacterium SpSt-418 TaxID=2282169 RepID=A0A7C3KJP3_9CYAN|nr:DUF4278 domain-containing protein [Leptolyngbyaceae cyanobacterium M33_DOE_097]